MKKTWMFIALSAISIVASGYAIFLLLTGKKEDEQPTENTVVEPPNEQVP